MYIKRFVILLTIILTGGLLYAQEPVTNAVQLRGEWQFEKVVAQLYTQQDHKLLEEKTYTIKDSAQRINAIVPLDIRFEGDNYYMTLGKGIDTGKYIVPANGLLLLRHETAQPGRTLDFQLPSPRSLTLHMPASNYKDNIRHLAVKLVYTCYYWKKY